MNVTFTLEQYNRPAFFFVANMYNNEAILPNWMDEFVKVAHILGHNNVFLSIFENDSKDSTSTLLHDFRHRLNELQIKMDGIRKSYKNTQERIEYLSSIRNHALAPLFGLLNLDDSLPSISPTSHAPASPYNGSDEIFLHSLTTNNHSKIVFLNDIYFTATDVLRLISTADLNYDIVCGLDFYTKFYDQYATRDLNGDWFADHFPFVRHMPSQKLARGREFEVYACWNGGVAMNPGPFLKKRLQFRTNAAPACIHSECFLICEDFRRLGYSLVLVNPDVKVTYTLADYLFHHYLTPVSDFFLAIFYYPIPEYVAPNVGEEFNLSVVCGTPK